MGLCLCVLDKDPGDGEEPEEIAECDVGHSSDFGCFRDSIARHLDASSYPTLMEHSDCDGEWSLPEIPLLEQELREIGAAFQKLPPEEPNGAFEHTAESRMGAESLYDLLDFASSGEGLSVAIRLCQTRPRSRTPDPIAPSASPATCGLRY